MRFRSKSAVPAVSRDLACQDWSRPAKIELYDPRLEAYLDNVLARLPRSVPAERRSELRRELGAHLESLVEAHRELDEHGDPVEAALRQFGDGKTLARKWSREWKQSSAARPDWRSLLVASFTFLIGLIMFICVGVTMEAALGVSPWLGWLFAGALPLATGVTWALRNRRSPRGDNRLPLALLILALLLSGTVTGEPEMPDFWRYALATRLCTWCVVMLSGAGLTVCLDLITQLRTGRPIKE